MKYSINFVSDLEFKVSIVSLRRHFKNMRYWNCIIDGSLEELLWKSTGDDLTDNFRPLQRMIKGTL